MMAGLVEPEASKATCRGALPDVGMADRAATGGAGLQAALPTIVYWPSAE